MLNTSRRTFLAATGSSVALAATAGCIGGENNGEGPDSLPQPTRGDTSKDLPVLQLFEDYGCPHCLTFDKEYLPRLIEDYVSTGRLVIEYYDFPLPVRQLSKPAAVSGRVVQDLSDNETFWEYKSRVMDNQQSLSYELFRTIADDLGLDGQKVVSLTQGGGYDNIVESDKSYGRDAGVSGTPGLVMDNGSQIEMGSYSAITNQIELILQEY